MAELELSIEWLSSGEDDPVFRDTSAQLAIHLDGICLTRNEDVWSRTVRDTALVSTYPLAMWFAASWWRLNFEPLPQFGIKPSLDWRMAHELGAANHGFVWPRILFAPDGEVVNIWAEQWSKEGQSLQYLFGLDAPRTVKIDAFQRQIGGFFESVLNRLNALGHSDTELAALWSFIKEDRSDPEISRIRVLEAQMGFDPEECPEGVISEALRIERSTGSDAMSELAPIFGRRTGGTALGEIERLASAKGMQGHPEVSADDVAGMLFAGAPWQRGVDAARWLRTHLGNGTGPIENAKLLGLLGITESQLDNWDIPTKNIVAVAKPVSSDALDYISRKRHPIARRFEFARLIGEILEKPRGDDNWLVCSDVATARQKRQRAFAAEFLCPVQSLVEFLEGDYSESSLEDAAEHFRVSEKTVESLLANNGYLEISSAGPKVPYRLAA